MRTLRLVIVLALCLLWAVYARGAGNPVIEDKEIVGSLKFDAGATVDEFSTDGTLAGNSEIAVPVEKAVRTYVATPLIDSVLADDHTWIGPTQLITAGENLAQFETAYLKSDGKYWLIDADLVATSAGKIVMVTATINADASGIVLLPSESSFIRDDSTDKWTVTNPGDEMFLALATGELTNDVSGYTTLDIVRFVGYMETSVILNFNVSKVYLEIDTS